MTDARTDALTAPTAEPGIVAALVYIGDQIAAIATERRHTPARTPQTPEPEPTDGPGPPRPYANGYRPVPAQHPTDRHLLPKEGQ